MTQPRDDWHKPRSKTDHLTRDDIRKLKAFFDLGWSPRNAARELQCSSRTANKYYAEFRGDVRSVPEKKPNPPVRHRPIKIEHASRFYKGNFDL